MRFAALCHDTAVDGHKGREAAQHAEPQRGVDDVALQIPRPIPTRGVTVLEIAQVRPRPLGRDRHGVAGPPGDRGRPAATVAGGAAQHERTGRGRPVASGHHQRHPREEVGQAGRGGRPVDGLQPVGAHLQVVDQRRPDPAVDGVHRLVEPIFALDQFATPATHSGQPAQESRVDGLVDADGVDPDVVDVAGQFAQDLVLVADLTVGDQDDDGVAPVVRVVEQSEGLPERSQQFGAASFVDPGEVLDRPVPVPIAGLHQPLGKSNGTVDAIVEREHREPVTGGERVDDPGRRTAGGHHLPAAHAAGPVQHQHHVAWPRRCRRHRRQHGQLIGALLALGVGYQHQRVGEIVTAITQPEHEVAVGALAGPDPQAPVVGFHRVQTRPDLRQCQPGGVDADVDGERDGMGEAGQQHRRGDPRGVGDRVGVVGVTVADRLAGQGRARDVARRHDEREAERRLTVLVGQRADQSQRDADPFAGQDVAHPHREDVGALLLGDRGPAAGGDRVVVGLTGGTALLQFGVHLPSVGGHPHPGDGPAVGHRKDVGGFQWDVEGVDEVLGQLDAGGEPGNVGPDVDTVQGQIAPLGAQGAETSVVRRCRQARTLGFGHRNDGHAHGEFPPISCVFQRSAGLGRPVGRAAAGPPRRSREGRRRRVGPAPAAGPPRAGRQRHAW